MLTFGASAQAAENLRLSTLGPGTSPYVVIPMGAYHITTFADSGITRLEELKGKRVYLGPPGGAAYVTTSRLIEAVTGMKPDKDYEVARLGWDAASQSFQDGHIDVYFNPTLAPSPVISQMR
jgi:TRAP-type uncharacterized transport system substrate-binding protein